MQQILVCDSWNHSVQAKKWLHSKMEPRWGVKNCTLENQWSEPSGNGKPSSQFRLAWWPHPQRTVLFCQSFSLVVEINLGKKFGGQACSRGKADQNTTEELLAQNLTILFLPPQTTGLFCAVPGHWSLQLREECSNREDMDGLGKTKSFIPCGLQRGRTLESDGHMNPG